MDRESASPESGHQSLRNVWETAGKRIQKAYRIFVKLGYRKKPESTKKKSRHSGHYDTPTALGIKWQMDIKYVPVACYMGTDCERFYQYTMLEEASRERFIYAYRENSGYTTVDFMKRALRYFGYKPAIIQTDNGGEFTNTSKTKRIHLMDRFCMELHLAHQLIRPRTPWHNGKVERSHRNDQERFYNYLSFYSFEDFQKADESLSLSLKSYTNVCPGLEISSSKTTRAGTGRHP